MSKPNRKIFSRCAVSGKNRLRPIAVLALLAFLLLPFYAAIAKSGDKSYFVYVGTYTRTAGKGIYGYRFSPSTGEIVPLGLLMATAHPSFLVVHPNHRFLYATNEHGSANEPGDTVSAYAMDLKTGKLTFLSRVASKGVGPCHITIDKTGKFLAAAYYGSGSVAVFPIHSDGTLGEASAFIQHEGKGGDPVSQAGPHAHCVLFSPDNRFLIVAEHGIDKVFVYRFNHTNGTLEPNDPPFIVMPPASAPRHLAFHPNGKYLYLINERSSKLTTFDYDAARGTLTEAQSISALPEGFAGQSRTAEVVVDRAGKFVYGSNRGDDSIVVFAVDPGNGTLSPLRFVSAQGKTPRHIAIDPTGAYLFAANQDSASVVIFRIDRATGKLTPTGQTLKEAAEPACVIFVAAK
jgi:6-phosphogluconolactonase